MSRKENSLSSTRRAGLDLCDATVEDFCSRGLLTVTPQVLERLAEFRRNLESHKLRRFAAEVSALHARFATGIREGDVTAEVMTNRLARLQFASRKLRALMDDPTSETHEIEDLAGKTWRDADLELHEGVLLVEMAWESARLEEGFRVDSSYFLARGGEIFCELKIIPLNIRFKIDDSLKPQRPDPRIYERVGIFPGDTPHRIKLLNAGSEPAPPHEMIVGSLDGAPEDIGSLQRRFLDRKKRPFPPVVFPLFLSRPLVQYDAGRWWIVGRDGHRLPATPPPGADRRPAPRACFDAFVEMALTSPIEGLLLLLIEDADRIAAAPVGAVTPDAVIRFGLDASV